MQHLYFICRLLTFCSLFSKYPYIRYPYIQDSLEKWYPYPSFYYPYPFWKLYLQFKLKQKQLFSLKGARLKAHALPEAYFVKFMIPNLENPDDFSISGLVPDVLHALQVSIKDKRYFTNVFVLMYVSFYRKSWTSHMMSTNLLTTHGVISSLTEHGME